MNLRRALVLAGTGLCLFTACEKADLTEGLEDAVEQSYPTSVGQGTQTSPYTVGQVMEGDTIDHKLHWFIGFVVGSTYQSMQNAVFEDESRYDSNILISDNPQCKDFKSCIPVELNTAALKKAFSLNYNSSLFRQCILLQGRYSLYFRTDGIRDVQTGYWLPGFDYTDLTPTEWDKREEDF